MFLLFAVVLNLALVACAEQTMEPTGLKEATNEWSYDEFTGPEYWGEVIKQRFLDFIDDKYVV